MTRESDRGNVKRSDPPEEERRNYLKTVGALVAGLAVGGVAGWLSKPAERVEVPGVTVTAPGVTAPGVTETLTKTVTVPITPKVAEPPIVYIQIRDPGDFNHLVLMEGAQRFAEWKGLKFESLAHRGDEELALRSLDAVVTKYGPERVVFVSVPHSMGHFDAMAKYAEEKGLYWAAWYGMYAGFKIENCPHLVWAGQSPAYEEGYATAEALVKAMGGKGNIVFLGGGIGIPCWEFRVLGMLDYIKTVPEVKILDGGFLGLTTEDSIKVMDTYIAKYGKQINGAWGVFISPSLGALIACERAGLAVPVSTIDVTPEIIDYIIKGKEGETRICATWDNGTYWCGLSAASVVYKALVEGWRPPEEMRGFHWYGYVVDKTNIEEVKAKYSFPRPDYEVDKYPLGPDNRYVSYPASFNTLRPTEEQYKELEPWM